MAGSPAPAVAHYRAKKAALSRDRAPDDPELLGAGRDLEAANAEHSIARILAEAPSLSDEVRGRIAALLLAGTSRTVGGDDAP
jgi:hypothetical protein